MGIAATLFLILFSLASVLIILLVLIQDEQGEGFGGLFGGGSSTPLGATSGNVLTRITSILGVIFMVSSLAVALALKSGENDNVIGESRQASGSGRDWFVVEEPIDAAESEAAVDSQ